MIDFQGVLPEKISFDDYPLDENVPETIMGFPGVKNEQNVLGYKSITIPGAVAGLLWHSKIWKVRYRYNSQ
ncbi:MAG: hypothetical protein CM15mP81_05820 [Alphaproteobacteria bacterium]|nr:MAG: hypothetical protein CM15mP81_05820 [Alphaproteobacteria bacterium]